MDSKNENEVVVEALIYTQIAAQHALGRYHDAKNTIEEDYWWSAFEFHIQEFEDYRNYLLDDDIANFIKEIILLHASYLSRTTLVKFILAESQRKRQRIATYEC